MLGEVYGSGLPLGYILIRTDNAAAGAKQRCIEQFISHIRTKWKIRAIATLTDKDWAEINAFLANYPEAKHQLCFWHCLRALKKRLSILQRTPAFYNVVQAMAEFPFIQEDFVPIGQQRNGTVTIHDLYLSRYRWLNIIYRIRLYSMLPQRLSRG